MNTYCPRRGFVRNAVSAALGVGGMHVFADDSVPQMDAVSVLDTSRVVRIPTDYPSLQAAVFGESQWLAVNEVGVTLHVESGYRIPDGVSFWNGSYGHVVITSDDEVVEVSHDFTGDLISVHRAIGPILATMIDMRHRGRHGYWCENAFGQIAQTHRLGKRCGIRNAGVDGVLCAHGGNMRIGYRQEWQASSAAALSASLGQNPLTDESVEISGSGRCNVHCACGSFVSVRSAVLTHSKRMNIHCSHASVLTCDGSDCSDAAEDGVTVSGGSQVDAMNVKANRCGRYGLSSARSSTLYAMGAKAWGSRRNDLFITAGSIMDVTSVHTTNGTPSIQDANVSEFNTIFGSGILFNEDA